MSEDGLSMQTEKVEAVSDWPPCRNLTEVRSFLGTCGYGARVGQDAYRRQNAYPQLRQLHT